MIVDAAPVARWSTARAASHWSITVSRAPAASSESAKVRGAPWNKRDTTRCGASVGMWSACANAALAGNTSLNG
jgi:hypothetical protein